jgi:hypothetical protein
MVRYHDGTRSYNQHSQTYLRHVSLLGLYLGEKSLRNLSPISKVSQTVYRRNLDLKILPGHILVERSNRKVVLILKIFKLTARSKCHVVFYLDISGISVLHTACNVLPLISTNKSLPDSLSLPFMSYEYQTYTHYRSMANTLTSVQILCIHELPIGPQNPYSSLCTRLCCKAVQIRSHNNHIFVEVISGSSVLLFSHSLLSLNR